MSAPRIRTTFIALLLLAGSLPAGRVSAQRVDVQPPELEGIEITDRAGETVPLDVTLIDEEGEEVRLGDLLAGDRPAILQFVYYECPMLCSLVLNGFLEGAKQLDWSPGEEYTILSVSFDPDDTPVLGAAKRDNYVREIDRPRAREGWRFLTGDPAEVRRLADACGFPYRYIEKDDQFSHPAGMFVLTPDGTISRTLYGIEYRPQDLRFSLMEASEGRLGSPMEKLVLYCFRYDPDSQGYVLVAVKVMQIGGAVTVVLLGGFLLIMWMRERRRSGRAPGTGDAGAAGPAR